MADVTPPRGRPAGVRVPGSPVGVGGGVPAGAASPQRKPVCVCGHANGELQAEPVPGTRVALGEADDAGWEDARLHPWRSHAGTQPGLSAQPRGPGVRRPPLGWTPAPGPRPGPQADRAPALAPSDPRRNPGTDGRPCSPGAARSRGAGRGPKTFALRTPPERQKGRLPGPLSRLVRRQPGRSIVFPMASDPA